MSIAASLSHPSRRHLLARVLARLALLAVIFHALLPLTQHAIQRVQATNGIEQVVLCSALGFRTLALKDGLPVDADPDQPMQASKNCPVCLVTANLGHAILPSALPLLLPGLAITVLYGAAPDSTPAQARYLPAQARAPPLS